MTANSAAKRETPMFDERSQRPMTTKHSLSAARQHLVELFQEINFGRVEQLEVRDGEPVFEPPPRVFREVKFGRTNGPNPARGKDDFLLKDTVRELFELFDRERALLIENLDLQHGLPVRMTVAGGAKKVA
jgi:hypothetical protein